MALTKITSNAFAASAVDSDAVGANTITTAKIADNNVTHAKLHTDMNFTGKTLTLSDDHLSGNKIHGGVISNFASTGIDDNASSTTVTITADGGVGIGTSTVADAKLEISGGGIDIQDSGYPRVRFYVGSTFKGGVEAVQNTGSMISTSVANDLAIRSQSNMLFATGGNTERMRINSSGNVGIGQSNPDARLDLGTLNSSTAGSNQMFQLGAFGFRHDDTGGFNHLYLERNYGGWQTTPQMTFKANGNVGIGTDSPNGKLEIMGGNGDQLYLDNNGERFTQISLQHNNVQNGALWLDDTDSMVDLYANTGHGIRLKTGGDNPRLTVTSSGNVGIGDTSPGQKLVVVSDSLNQFNYGYRDSLIIDRTADENLDDTSSPVPADRYWPQGNLMLADGNTWNADTNGPGLSFYKHRDADGNQYVQAFIGTRGVWGSNNTDLRFYVNNSGGANLLPTSPQMVIDGANGNVGIGTGSPLTKLHVKSEGAGNSYGSLYLQVDTATNYPAMVIQTATGGNYTETHGLYIKNTAAGYGLRIDDTSSDTSPFVVDTEGRVGIGTSSPQAKLHVTSSVLIEGGSTDSRTLGFTNASGSTGWSIGNGIIDSTHNFRIYDNTAGAARVTVDGSGRVGINTTSPSYTLDVNGKARAYGFIGHVIKEWNITGSYSQGTSYVFTTRSYINSLGWGDGMYRFVVYSDTYNAGTSHYQTFVAYNAFYFVQQSSNAPQAFTMGWNVAMGHAPNTGTRAVDLVLRHRYGSASPNAADQQFEFVPVNGLSNLTGSGGYNLKIRLFKIP